MLKGHDPEALRFQDQAVDLWRAAGDRQGTATGLHRLGAMAVCDGRYEAARAYLTESIAISRDLGHPRGVAAALMGFVQLALALNQPRRALRLAGEAEAIYQAAGAPLPPRDQANFERKVGAARKRLPQAEGETAWAEGQAMSLQQAVAYALEAPESPEPAPP